MNISKSGVLEYYKNLTVFIQSGQDNLFFESVLRNQHLQTRLVDVNHEWGEHDDIKSILYRFWQEVNRLEETDNDKLFNFIINKFPIPDVNFYDAFIKNGLKYGSETWITNVIAPILKNKKRNIHALEIEMILNRNDQKTLNLVNPYINWLEMNLKYFFHKDTLDLYLINKVKNCDIKYLICEIEVLISNNLSINDVEEFFAKDWQLLKNQNTIKENTNTFFIDYTVIKKLLSNNPNIDKNILHLVPIISVLLEHDPHFTREMKNVVKKYPEAKRLVGKLKLENKLITTLNIGKEQKSRSKI